MNCSRCGSCGSSSICNVGRCIMEQNMKCFNVNYPKNVRDCINIIGSENV